MHLVDCKKAAYTFLVVVGKPFVDLCLNRVVHETQEQVAKLKENTFQTCFRIHLFLFLN